MSLFQVTKKQVIENYELRTMTGDIVSFTPSYSQLLPDPFSDLNVTANILATGGNGTPDNPNPINGYSSANIVNTQNESIADLFSVDSDFRGTVAFNQVLDVYSLSDNAQWESESIQSNGNNKYTITFSGNETSRFWFIIANNEDFDIVAGHKYLFITNFKMLNGSFSNAGTNIRFSTSIKTVETIQTGTSGIGDYIFAATATGTANKIHIYNSDDSIITSSTIMTIQPILIDLTAMFGSTIADYIYSLEQATAGAGVAFFRSIYPADYYDYDSGTTEIVGKETPEATIAFGQTVYGGVLDVTRGKLSITWGSVDMGTLNDWYYWASRQVFNSSTTGKKIGLSNIKSDIYETITSGSYENLTDGQMCGNVGNVGVYIKNLAYTDANAFKTAMSGHYLVYELATPFDIDLTPVQINALLGVNNVFADCGETTVTCLI